MSDYIKEFITKVNDKKNEDIIFNKLVKEIRKLNKVLNNMTLVYGVYLGEARVTALNKYMFSDIIDNVVNPAFYIVFSESFLDICIGAIKER